ncbi:hypothetical protein LHK_02707 [Laribacter hongkongensis HLHK9]|uniref:Uncharacterized protein n=1 Tax=Laribacter hongkongensis (strain HLHK9) TaxID=557598 RepID=C1DCR9_LARHH|nr:hypothetical protein LHK_02707 [Laribacter hongkongensis HLHK9]
MERASSGVFGFDFYFYFDFAQNIPRASDKKLTVLAFILFLSCQVG